MISSPNRSRRDGRPVSLIVIHTAEGARTATELGNYFANPAVQASSHVGIDDTGIEQYVPYTEAAWATRAANNICESAELCGFAAWTRDQWLGEHHRMLELAAGWIRDRCTARAIPIRKLTPDQVAAGEPGVLGHVDWTVGMHDGTHTDPGTNFPWDVVIALATAGTQTSPTPTDSNSEDEPVAVIPINVLPNGTFRATVMAEAGESSAVVARAWISFGSTWGDTHFKVCALDDAGHVMPGLAEGDVPNNHRGVMEVPSGAVMVTVEGHTYTPSAIPAAALVVQPK